MKLYFKIALLSLALMVSLGFTLFGRSAGSYVSTAWSKGSDAVRETIPLRFELDRLEAELEKTSTSVEQARKDLAREEVALEDMAVEVARLEGAREEDRRLIATLKDALEHGGARLAFHTSDRASGPSDLHAEDPSAVRTSLRLAMDRFRGRTGTLEARRKALEARKSTVQSLERRIQEIASWRLERQGRLEQMRAQLALLDAVKTERIRADFDGGHLARIEAELDDISKRIRTELRYREADLARQVDQVREQGLAASRAEDLLQEAERLLEATEGGAVSTDHGTPPSTGPLASRR